MSGFTVVGLHGETVIAGLCGLRIRPVAELCVCVTAPPYPERSRLCSLDDFQRFAAQPSPPPL